VPAIIISPRIPRNLVDHRRYEHSTIVSTVIRLFGLKELTARSSLTSDLKPLAILDVPRTDAPMTLPDPMGSVIARLNTSDKTLDDDSTGRVAATVASGLARHLEIAPESEHAAIIARVDALQTRGAALEYLKEVQSLVQAARQGADTERTASVRIDRLHRVRINQPRAGS
jgi:phospholipase C